MQKLLNDVNIEYLKGIHLPSLTPFMIYNEQKIIICANKSLLEKFNFDLNKPIEGKLIDFISQKIDNKFIDFSKISINKIITNSQIFSYFPNNDSDEVFFYITTFYMGQYKKEKIYYSILKEITDLEEKIMEKSIRALVIASQLKDNDTGNHIKRVNTYSYILSKKIHDTKKDLYPEIDEDFMNKIFKVSSMHDVGKIGTPDYILTKPGKLTEQEFNIMKEHTINGAFILSKMAGQMARDIALFHHEKYDGTGYPYQLKGEEIPLSARIVALTDVYDALRMKRHYKPSFSHKDTKKMISEERGAQFDPNIVDAFLKIENQFNDIYEKMSDDASALMFHKDTL